MDKSSEKCHKQTLGFQHFASQVSYRKGFHSRYAVWYNKDDEYMIRSDKGVFWAILLPLIAVLIWSLNIAVTRYVAEYISPVSISFYRWLIAFLILTPWILPRVWQQRELIRPHLKQLIVCSYQFLVKPYYNLLIRLTFWGFWLEGRHFKF